MEKEKTIMHRDSNLELLRMICMLFVVFHHFMVHCAFPNYKSDALNGLDASLGVALTLNGFFCVAVNCFVLITGYFGLRFKIRKFLKLYLICAFYSLVGYFVHLYVSGAHIGRSILNYSLFALTNSKWWFVNCYVVLFFTAPLLNVAIESLDKKQYLVILILLSIVNMYFGFLGRAHGYNQYGYDVQQFIYLYVIGGYFRKFFSHDKVKNYRKWCLILYIVFSLLIGLQAIIETFVTNSNVVAYYYCNPLMVASAICLFCYFLSFEFHNRAINRLGSGVLAVYLFQDQLFIGYEWLYPSVTKELTCLNQVSNYVHIWSRVVIEFATLLLMSMSFLIALLLFDQIRALLFKPIWAAFDRIEPKIDNLIIKTKTFLTQHL